jgi:hypothetical protein
MSWSTSTGTAGNSKSEISIAEPVLSDIVETEQTEQFEAAHEAALLLAKVVGREGDRVVITLNGHANPGHGPREGWANETITVQVSAIPQVEPAAAE